MTEIKFITIDDVAKGLRYSTEILIQADEASNFLDLTGDFNPLHRDQLFASQTSLQYVNLAGQHITSLCVGIIGTHMPGPGWSCLSVDAKYIRPTYKNTLYVVVIECTSKSKAVGVVNWTIEVKEKNTGTCVSRLTVVTQRII